MGMLEGLMPGVMAGVMAGGGTVVAYHRRSFAVRRELVYNVRDLRKEALHGKFGVV